MVGGADGPMVLFTSLALAKHLFVPITVVAYLYLGLTYGGYPYLGEAAGTETPARHQDDEQEDRQNYDAKVNWLSRLYCVLYCVFCSRLPHRCSSPCSSEWQYANRG